MVPGFDEPTLAYEQAMSGAERVKPRATPAGAFERAREYLRAGKRIDMVALAADLGVARGTLYRWTGDRERLLADATWAEARSVAEHMLQRSQTKTGVDRIQTVCADFIAAFAGNASVNAFLEHERNSGLELLTRLSGGFRPRLVAWIATMIRTEIDVGRYRAPADPELLADGIVTIGERFLHHSGDPEVTPDATSATRTIAVLLREDWTPEAPERSGRVVPEASLEQTEAGAVATTPGWFVLNARDARWGYTPGLGHGLPLTGIDDKEAERLFPMLGMAIRVMNPGEPSTTYHWETEQEDFLVLAGEAILLIEGQERPLRQWDFVHCPPEARHAFVGAGTGPCVLLCASSRQFQQHGPWGYYCSDPVAKRYNASSPEDTQDPDLAYDRFEPGRLTRYPDDLLPDQRRARPA